MWQYAIRKNVVDDAAIWWNSISNAKYKDEEIEQVILDKWSQDKKKDPTSVFSCAHFLLQVHGCIQ